MRGNFREVDMYLYDNNNQRVMRMFRPTAGFMSTQQLYVEAPPGTSIGYVSSNTSGFSFSPSFTIVDPNNSPLYQINSPGGCCGLASCGSDIDFQILANGTNQSVGTITKQWAGYMQEQYSRADNFGVRCTFSIALILLRFHFHLFFFYFSSLPSHGCQT